MMSSNPRDDTGRRMMANSRDGPTVDLNRMDPHHKAQHWHLTDPHHGYNYAYYSGGPNPGQGRNDYKEFI